MPTTAEYLERLVQAKNNIANAITNAGGTVNSGDGLEDFSADINTIPTSGNIDSLTVYSNGTYTAPSGVDGYNPVSVYVANSYSASDEGKVVDNGALVSQTSTTKTVNGTYDTTLNNEVVINVPNTYVASDEGKVVDNSALVSQTSTTVTDNGTYNTTTNNEVVVALPLTTKSVTNNGTYTASSDSAKGYTSVTVNVPNTYTQSDEGKVVSSGALTSQTSTTKTVNGTYNTTTNNEVVVAVPNTYTNADEGKVVNNNALVSQTSASDSNITTNGTYTYDTTYNNSKKVIVAVPNTYTNADEGKVVDSGALVSQTSTNINTNGTYNTTTNNEVVVAVPNTYTSGDEGKVVSNGALTAQTARTVTTNNTTYDTTLNNSVTVDIAIPQPTLITKSITSNGTYNASSDSADGYSSVSVAVPNTYGVSDEGKVVSNGALTAQTATSTNVNGTIDTTLNNSIVVNVPNTYTQSDEGKVVSNGALVSQTSTTITTNNTTVDTTLINSVDVQVPVSNNVYIVYGKTDFSNPSSLRLFMETPTKLVIYGKGNVPKTSLSSVVACINTNIENVSPLLTGTHRIDVYKGDTASKEFTVTLTGGSNILSYYYAASGSSTDCWYGELNLS